MNTFWTIGTILLAWGLLGFIAALIGVYNESKKNGKLFENPFFLLACGPTMWCLLVAATIMMTGGSRHRTDCEPKFWICSAVVFCVLVGTYFSIGYYFNYL
jgi:hypothetical protein